MDGFTETDIKFYRHLIQSNVIQAVHQLIKAARNLHILVDDKEMVCVILQRFWKKIYFLTKILSIGAKIRSVFWFC